MDALVRPMTAADVEAATEVLRRGRWGSREAFFAFTVAHAACHPFVAEIDGDIVATGLGTTNGATGWVGMIFVDEAQRRRGLGQTITEAVVEDLAAAGCRTLLLVATEMGRPIYERLGFEVEDTYVGLSASGSRRLVGPQHEPVADESDAVCVRPFERADRQLIDELDSWATGEDRSHLLDAVLDTASSIVALGPGGPTIRGYASPTGWGGRPTIARDADAGIALLEHRRAAGSPDEVVRTALLESNPSIGALVALGWERTWTGVRMRLGPPIDWHAEAIWGQFNFALG